MKWTRTNERGYAPEYCSGPFKIDYCRNLVGTPWRLRGDTGLTFYRTLAEAKKSAGLQSKAPPVDGTYIPGEFLHTMGSD